MMPLLHLSIKVTTNRNCKLGAFRAYKEILSAVDLIRVRRGESLDLVVLKIAQKNTLERHLFLDCHRVRFGDDRNDIDFGRECLQSPGVKFFQARGMYVSPGTYILAPAPRGCRGGHIANVFLA